MRKALLALLVAVLAVGVANLFPVLHKGRRGTSLTAAHQPARLRHDKARRPALVQPSAAHPLGVLEIGDSLGEDLGYGLAAELSGHRDVRLYVKAVGDTGLANVAYYNWPAVFRSELRSEHPGLVIVFLGGNDAQGFEVNGEPAVFGTSFWHEEYAARVATMMAEAQAAKAEVLWVGMPIMASPSFSAEMQQLNAIYRAEAAHFSNVRFYSTWKLFSNAEGQYAQDLPAGPHGAMIEVRDPDGVHIAPPSGDDFVASAVLHEVSADWSVRL